MNNKGFAITGILYGLMILFVIVITSFLAVVVGKSKRDSEVLNEVKSDLSLGSSEVVNWSKSNYANYGWTYNGYRYSYVTQYRGLSTFRQQIQSLLLIQKGNYLTHYMVVKMKRNLKS